MQGKIISKFLQVFCQHSFFFFFSIFLLTLLAAVNQTTFREGSLFVRVTILRTLSCCYSLALKQTEQVKSMSGPITQSRVVYSKAASVGQSAPADFQLPTIQVTEMLPTNVRDFIIRVIRNSSKPELQTCQLCRMVNL